MMLCYRTLFLIQLAQINAPCIFQNIPKHHTDENLFHCFLLRYISILNVQLSNELILTQNDGYFQKLVSL